MIKAGSHLHPTGLQSQEDSNVDGAKMSRQVFHLGHSDRIFAWSDKGWSVFRKRRKKQEEERKETSGPFYTTDDVASILMQLHLFRAMMLFLA